MTVTTEPRDERPAGGIGAAAYAHAGALLRTLTGFASWAMTFAGVGATAGLFSLFGFSLASSGPAFFWSWPLCVAGTALVCLMWAEMASHYPLAGVMYKWPTILAGRATGWWIGWTYLFAIIFVLTAYYFILPAAVIPLFDLEDTTRTRMAISLVALAVAAVFNAAGAKLLGRFTEIAVLAELFVLFVITTLVLIFGANQDLGVLFESGGTAGSFDDWLPGFLGGGILISLWVLYGFEHGATIGEETIDAERRAPRAIVYALLGTAALGTWFLLCFILAIPGDPASLAQSLTPLEDIIDAALPDAFSILYLALIALVVFLGANVFFMAAVRQMFSMARDGQLPFSRELSRTRAATGSPYVAVGAVAAITAVPFVASQEIAVLVTGATAAMWLVYTAVMLVCLRARLRGWPPRPAPFRLGRLGIPLNVLAIAYGAFVTVNLLWPRDTTNPVWQLEIRAAYWMIGAPLIVGLAFYVLAHRRRLHTEAGA
jgi:amino acid transporter